MNATPMEKCRIEGNLSFQIKLVHSGNIISIFVVWIYELWNINIMPYIDVLSWGRIILSWNGVLVIMHDSLLISYLCSYLFFTLSDSRDSTATFLFFNVQCTVGVSTKLKQWSVMMLLCNYLYLAKSINIYPWGYQPGDPISVPF